MAATAWAQQESPAEWNLPPIVPRPAFMSEKPVMPDILLKDKREDFYVTGFPVIGVDDEEGVTLGAKLQLFNNGSRYDPFFRSSPYRSSHSITGVWTSNGVIRGLLEFDYPYSFGSDWRVRFAGGYVRNPINNYFGVGDATMGPLTFPGAPGVEFDDFDEYQAALDRVVGGQTYERYNRWRSEEIPFGFTFERDMLGGILRPIAGLRFGHVRVEDYSGRVIDGVVQERTRLRDDAESGRISGFDGGWNNFLKLGLTVDTRDFEPDPTDGVLIQSTAEIASRFLASDFDYQLITTSATGFWSPFGISPRLVLAGRAVYGMQFGDVPFFAQNTLATNQYDAFGLGGFRSLRGFKRNRFVGDSAVVIGGEARWSFAETYLGSQHLRFVLVGFAESGRVHDGVRLEFADWRSSFGGGFRLGWNLSTVISFDYAVSDEDAIFYLEVGQPF